MILRRRYHVHPPGIVYCIITTLLGLGALNSQNNLLFGAFGLALGGLLISGIVSGAMLMGLRVTRLGVEPAPEGEPVVIRYEVENRSRIYPIFAVRIGEHRSHGATFQRHIEPRETLVMHLAPRSRARLSAACPSERRGEFTLGATQITTRFPFGIIRKSIIIPEHTLGLVHPRRVDARRLNEAVGRALAGEDPCSDRQWQGAGLDLLALREYTPGDSPRRIAWRVSARLGELIVRDSQPTKPARRWVALDLTAGDSAMAGDDACENAIALTAAVIARITTSGAAPGLLVPASGLRIAPTPATLQGVAGATTEHAKERELIDELARLDLSRCRPAPMDIGSRIGPNASVVVVSARTLTTPTPPRQQRTSPGNSEAVTA
ncbi:MAG: DUF58 domain-containing protein [Phycisphaeraceae bacterium]|nr:DUF58 domain-containing protein [Phycisphaeraceae bacterium]